MTIDKDSVYLILLMLFLIIGLVVLHGYTLQEPIREDIYRHCDGRDYNYQTGDIRCEKLGILDRQELELKLERKYLEDSFLNK